MPKAKYETLKLSALQLVSGLQLRLGGGLTNPDHVSDLRAAVRAKAKLPRPKVMRVADAGDGTPHGLLVYDGIHTVTAHLEEHPSARIECEVVEGTWWDARVAAAGCNHHSTAALKRTNEEKRHSVRVALDALAHKGEAWPIDRLAAYCGVSDGMVRELVAERKAEAAVDPDAPPEPKYTTRKDGRRQPVKVARKAKAARNGDAAPPAFDWHAAEAAMGVVQRCPDDVARAAPAAKDTPEYKALTKSLEKTAEAFSAFRAAAGRLEK